MKNELPNNSKVIFSGIVGSQSYGLATETSDTDRKFVYIQDNEDILSNRYVPQIDLTPDHVGYELRRFLELVSVGNPNVLELLYLPERCVETQLPEWVQIWLERSNFLSKKCFNTFSGYAMTQLNKASGLNKKFNYEKHRTERKTIVDFMKVVDNRYGKTLPMKDFLEKYSMSQNNIGLTSIDGFRNSYKIYIGDKYKGIGNGNQPKKSIVEKKNKNCLGIAYFNIEAYSTHCKDYGLYKKWLKDRNEDRVATNKKHGQDYDGKNILHVVRLIMTAQEIPTQLKINVDRTAEREYLLSIKNGKIDLKKVIDEWTVKADQLKDLYVNSKLKEDVDMDFIRNLELKIRNNGNI